LVTASKTTPPKRGEIWFANLEPQTHGIEPGKERPVLVLQRDSISAAEHYRSVIVIPGTSQLKGTGTTMPLRARILARAKLHKDTDFLVGQVRSIAKERLTRGPVAMLSKAETDLIAQALAEVCGLPPPSFAG
jgi:mRNA-degrading endonuclease toxin of MazEF toxin-antitoxin module